MDKKLWNKIFRENSLVEIKLKKEGGVTRISLENLKNILKDVGKESISKVTFHFNRSDDARLHIEWYDDKTDRAESWDFTGFSAGYGGEGPRGLVDALKMLDISGWDFNKVVGLKPGRYKIL